MFSYFFILLFFIFFYSASEITELYSRFSKNLAPKQYQPEQHNDTTNEFCTHITPESGDILTTHHINSLAKHAEAEADAEAEAEASSEDDAEGDVEGDSVVEEAAAEENSEEPKA